MSLSNVFLINHADIPSLFLPKGRGLQQIFSENCFCSMEVNQSVYVLNQ